MKSRWLLSLCALSLGFFPPCIRAQEADPLPESTTASDLEQPDPFGETLPLIPEAPVSQPAPAFEPDSLPSSPSVPRSLKPPKPSETRLAIEAQQRQVQMRKARIKAELDQDLQALQEAGRRARTDAERRYAMNLYYDKLFARMLKIDPSLRQDELEERKKEAVAPMRQDQLRASVWTPTGEAAR